MTRQEAIKILYEIHADAFVKDNCWLKEHADSLLKYLDQPLTLVDLLGWEEGVEYEYKAPKVLKVENNRLYAKSEECSSGWCNFPLFTDEIEDLRQAKKVEPKPKAYHVKDEYSFNCLMEELDKHYVFVHSGENYIYEKGHCDGRKYYQWTKDFEEIKDTHDIIEYHKEEPKYKWRFKSVKTIRIDGKVLYFHHAEDCDLILDSYPNVRYITEKLLREELRGTRFNVADFERVE